MRDGLWTEVEPSSFRHEREALDFVRRRLPDREPWRAWSNFTFVDTNGRPAEVDLLVVAPRSVVLVEVKSFPDGELSGDARTPAVLPALEQARQRGAAITVFVRTGRDAQDRWLREIQRVAARVVRYHHMHQKIVVVDEQITLLGSLNVLSHTGERGGTHDIMVVHEGRGFATSILKHEHAAFLAKPPRTTRCEHDEIAEVWRSPSTSRNHVWCWRCPSCHKKWKMRFPDDSRHR